MPLPSFSEGCFSRLAQSFPIFGIEPIKTACNAEKKHPRQATIFVDQNCGYAHACGCAHACGYAHACGCAHAGDLSHKSVAKLSRAGVPRLGLDIELSYDSGR
jgi:hypothetical protein